MYSFENGKFNNTINKYKTWKALIYSKLDTLTISLLITNILTNHTI